uniref:Uncharacterized protein n=1 Tax=Arundo donax TaxID=35708 RepID=A0A0A9BPZ0_ARUDO
MPNGELLIEPNAFLKPNRQHQTENYPYWNGKQLNRSVRQH